MNTSTIGNRSRRGVKRSLISILGLLAAFIAVAQPAAAQSDDSPVPTCRGVEATISGEGVIDGTDGDDVIVGSSSADTIDGGAGNDIICGGGGADVIVGGPGSDIIQGDNGADTISGNQGRDFIAGGAGNDVIFGGFGNDVVSGGSNADTVLGGPGQDIVRGGAGNDTVAGGKGADLAEGGGGDDVVRGGAGNDTVRGNAGDDELVGGSGKRDRLNGGPGADECTDRGSRTKLTNCESDFSLTVLHINDHHSHLNPDSGDLDLAGEGTRVSVGGFPSVVAKMDELTDANADGNVVKIHAGDAVTGTLFHSLFSGEADAALMNEACFDIFELGNHEFDDGDAGLADFLGFLGDSADCDTTVLAANVVPELGTPLNESGDIPFEPFTVIDYDGDKVGYVGLDIAGKTQNSSSPLPTTQFLDEIETAQKFVDQLTEDGINKIVLVTHIQLANDIDLANSVTGVDVIVGGDSHSLLGNFSDVGLNTQGNYPVRTADAAGAQVCIVHAWQYSAVVGELNVNFDADGNVTNCSGTPHLLLGDSFMRRPADGGDRVELVGEARDAVLAAVEEKPELSIVTPDADAQLVLDGFGEQVAELETQVIGTVPEDLCLERIPGEGRSTVCDVADTAVMGGDIQQLVTEAFRVRSFESDIAIQNSGGVRIDIPSGDITIADAYELLPFSNTIVNLEMTGGEIKATLEEAIDFALDPDGSTGAYPYAAGLRFDVDQNEPEGDRVTNIVVRRNGETEFAPLDPDATYIVATNSFVASGGDNYVTFEEVTADGRSTDTFLNYAQTFIDYIQQDAQGVLAKLPASEYSTQSFAPAAGDPQ